MAAVKIRGIGIKSAAIPADAVYSIKVPMIDGGDPVLDEDGKQVMTDRAVTAVVFDGNGKATVPSEVADALVDAYPVSIIKE